MEIAGCTSHRMGMRRWSATPMGYGRKKRARTGEAISGWLHQGEIRHLMVDMLASLDVVDADQHLKALDRRIDRTNESLKKTFHTRFAQTYPWIALATYALVLAFVTRMRAGLKAAGEEPRPQ